MRGTTRFIKLGTEKSGQKEVDMLVWRRVLRVSRVDR